MLVGRLAANCQLIQHFILFAEWWITSVCAASCEYNIQWALIIWYVLPTSHCVIVAPITLGLGCRISCFCTTVAHELWHILWWVVLHAGWNVSHSNGWNLYLLYWCLHTVRDLGHCLTSCQSLTRYWYLVHITCWWTLVGWVCVACSQNVLKGIIWVSWHNRSCCAFAKS